uniref:Uncharacterized protein n=1 Tax=Arundo donax TaxID=35708 RepID=A0A0A9ACR2_ARUDO
MEMEKREERGGGEQVFIAPAAGVGAMQLRGDVFSDGPLYSWRIAHRQKPAVVLLGDESGFGNSESKTICYACVGFQQKVFLSSALNSPSELVL